MTPARESLNDLEQGKIIFDSIHYYTDHIHLYAGDDTAIYGEHDKGNHKILFKFMSIEIAKGSVMYKDVIIFPIENNAKT